MKVKIEKDFFRQLKSIPKNDARRILSVIEALEKAADMASVHLDIKKIQGFKEYNFYRIRVGNYRIGIEYIHPDVIIITVAARKDIYNKFP